MPGRAAVSAALRPVRLADRSRHGCQGGTGRRCQAADYDWH